MFEAVKSFKNKLVGSRINISKRSEDSIGSKVLNKVEIHYRGPPHNFSYNGAVDEITVEQFQRINNIDVIQVDSEKYQYPNEKGEDIPVSDEERIVDVDTNKIRYYKLFSKKTTAINYLATYDLDLIQSSPQVSYTETSEGGRHLKYFQIILMFSAMIVVNILLDSLTASTYEPSYIVNTKNAVDYYIPLVIVIVAIFALYIQHIRDISRTMVHTMYLQALPMKIINANGVLPVLLFDSQTTPIWSYQSKLMHMQPGEAHKVINALQEWKADQLETAFVNSKITEKNIALMKIQLEQRELAGTDLGMFAEQDPRKRWMDMLIGGLVATFIAVIVIFSFF